MNRPSQTPRRRAILWAIRLTFIGFGVVLALALGEIALRIMIPKSNADLFFYDASTPRYKLMKPSYQGIVYGVPIRTNRLGFRDEADEIPPKQPGEYRILLLGDSFTVSAGVPYAEIASSRTQRELAKLASGRPVRVINLGVAGYSVIEYAAVLREIGLQLQPDAVAVDNYVPNDYELGTWLANRRIAQGARPLAQNTILQSLYLWQAFGPIVESIPNRIAKLFTRGAPVPAASVRATSRADEAARAGRAVFGPGSEGWAENTAAMLEMQEICLQRQIAFHVFLLPHPSSFARQAAHHQTVHDFLTAHQIACTDLLPAFQSCGRRPISLRVNLIDSHPNAAYNEIAAKAIAASLAPLVEAGPGEVVE